MRHVQPYSRIVGTTFGASPPVVVGMKQRTPQSTRPSFQVLVTTWLRSYHHFCRSPLCWAMEGKPLSMQLRPSLRGWLRLSLPLSLRWRGGPKRRFCAPQSRLRAWRFADIPTPLPNRNKTKEVSLMLSIHFRSASLALAARAIASALAPQRFSTTEAAAPVVPAPQSFSCSALASQHLAVNRPLPWGSA
jgi:hypothetical protein